MPANDVNSEMNPEELRPPASVLRTLAFVRSRGVRSSAPDADGKTTQIGIGALGLAAEALAQSLTARTLTPMTLGSPDWLSALLQRHRFATWSLGLPNLYYFHWLRSAEEAATTGAVPSAISPRPLVGRPSVLTTAPATTAAVSPWAASPPVVGPSWPTNAYPTPEFVLARRPRVTIAEEEAPSARRRDSRSGLDAPRFVPLLPGTLNASSVLPSVLTLHADTAQARSAPWTEPSLMQFAHPEVLTAEVVRRAETPSRRSNDAAPERTVDAPHMPVSYPPVPLASWLGVSASAPEQAYREAAPGLVRPQFSPASSHLLALPKLVAEVRTQPTFDRHSAAAFAALPRLRSAKTPAQIAGAAVESVQAAQSAATRTSRPSWPPSPMLSVGTNPMTVPPVAAERQPREPASSASADEPGAAARRSPLAAARTALEVVHRIGAQAAQTLQTLVFTPPLAPPPAPEAGRTPFFAALPSLLPLPRLRRAADTEEPTPASTTAAFYGVPSVFGPVPRQGASQITPLSAAARPDVTAPVLLEQLVAERHQPLITSTVKPSAPSRDGDLLDTVFAGTGLPAAFAGLPLPLVSRARIAAYLAEKDAQTLPDVGAAIPASQIVSSTVAGGVPQTAGNAGGSPTASASQPSITETVLTRAAALIGSLASSSVGSMAPAPASVEGSVFGTPFTAVRSFLGQFTLPRRRTALAPDSQQAAAPFGTGFASAAPFALPNRLASTTANQAALPTASFSPTAPADMTLPRRPQAATAFDSLNDTVFSDARSSITPSGVVAARLSAQHPVDFSAGVTARYLEGGASPQGRTQAELFGVSEATTQFPVPMLSSLAAPLLRFLRLGDLRRAEDTSTQFEQATGATTQPDSRIARPATQRPREFSADVTARYVETAGQTQARQSPSPLSPPQEAAGTVGQFTLSSVIAPLLRFLRLGELRRNEAAPDDSPAAALGAPRGQSETLLPRILSGSSAVPTTASVSALSSLTTPLLRFLRLSELRRAESDAVEFAQGTRNVSAHSSADRPIFGGTPPFILSPAAPIRMSEGERAETPTQRFWAFAAPVISLRLPEFPRRSMPETAGDGSASWPQATDSASRTSLTGVSRSQRDDTFDVSTAPVQSPVLTRWAEYQTGTERVSQRPGLIGRFFLPKRHAADAPADAPTSAAVPERQIFSSDGLSFARRRSGSSADSGRPSDEAAFAGSETATGAFQAQLMGPIRDFLLSTLSRILSPMDAIGEMPDGRQMPTEEPKRDSRLGVGPNLVWWDSGVEETREDEPVWGVPSFPTLGRPALMQDSPLMAWEAEGMGIQRRQVLESARRPELARSGIQALRMAMRHMSRSLISGGAARPATAPNSTMPTETRPAAILPQPGRRLPAGSDTAAPGPTVRRLDGSGTLSPTEFLDTIGIRPLRLVLPRTDLLLPPGMAADGMDEGTPRSGGRPLGQALTSLPIRSDGPEQTSAGREPAWMSGRSGGGLAERVPAMPLPMRGDRQGATASMTTQDPYVIQQARTGAAVATPTAQSQSSAHDHSDSGNQDGGQGDVKAMASEVWTVLRRKLALEATRAGNR